MAMEAAKVLLSQPAQLQTFLQKCRTDFQVMSNAVTNVQKLAALPDVWSDAKMLFRVVELVQIHLAGRGIEPDTSRVVQVVEDVDITGTKRRVKFIDQENDDGVFRIYHRYSRDVPEAWSYPDFGGGAGAIVEQIS